MTVLRYTFQGASVYTCDGLDQWDVARVHNMYSTFWGAQVCNVDLSTWDTSKSTTMSVMFRDASKFEGVGLNKWRTSLVTSFRYTFSGARAMDIDVSRWDVSRVTDLEYTFHNTAQFLGTGLGQWDTSAVVDLWGTFWLASKMNADLSSWIVDAVTSMQQTFTFATSFSGGGLHLWKTPALTNLVGAFSSASSLDVNLGGWDVAKVASLQSTFSGASQFKGDGCEKWATTSLTDMAYAFMNARSFNANLNRWRVSTVSMMLSTFANAAAFFGDGLELWDVSSVVSLESTFSGATTFHVSTAPFSSQPACCFSTSPPSHALFHTC